MRSDIAEEFSNKKILIVGFGKEGQSSLKFLLGLDNYSKISVADSNEAMQAKISEITNEGIGFYPGPNYLEQASQYDIILKSPGIKQGMFPDNVPIEKISSQTDLFLKHFGKQVIGVTGTKGKSTTSNLVYHILKQSGRDVLLSGNIGIPPFDIIDGVSAETSIVFELSSHQLAHVGHSPGIAILLNLFQEHLDFYKGFEEYALAKMNIARYQSKNDFFIYHVGDKNIGKFIDPKTLKGKQVPFAKSKFSSGLAFIEGDGKLTINFSGFNGTYNLSERTSLPGNHNLLNILAAVCACKISGINDPGIINGILTFEGLAHRLEYIGKFKGIHFYNDSIATIPEATIEALKTLKEVDTLILGGKDRGINYSALSAHLSKSNVSNLIFMGKAGERIKDELISLHSFQGKIFSIKDFDEIKEIISQHTTAGGICLLSPAASSYDMFSNFEERGKAFKKIAGNL